MRMKTRTIAPIPAAFLAACALAAAETPVLKIDAAKPGPPVGLRYGLMTEEINFSYDGGLYGELIRNRAFKEDGKDPVHWSLVQEGGAAGTSLCRIGRAIQLPISRKKISRSGTPARCKLSAFSPWNRMRLCQPLPS